MGKPIKPMGWIAILSVLLLATTALAAPKRLAVLEFQGDGIPIKTLQILSEAARTGALESTKRIGRINVYTKENQAKYIREMGGCEQEGECDVDTFKNIGADYGITGNVAKLGSVFIVTLSLYGVANGSFIERKEVEERNLLKVRSLVKTEAAALVFAGLGPRPTKQRIPVTRRSQASDDNDRYRNKAPQPNNPSDTVQGKKRKKRMVCKFVKESETGTLVIASIPKQAQIILDGRGLRNRTPYRLEFHDNKEHTVTLKRRYYKDCSETIQFSNLPHTKPKKTSTPRKASTSIRLDHKHTRKRVSLSTRNSRKKPLIIENETFDVPLVWTLRLGYGGLAIGVLTGAGGLLRQSSTENSILSGAFVGGVFGLAGSITGALIDRHKAKKENDAQNKRIREYRNKKRLGR